MTKQHDTRNATASSVKILSAGSSKAKKITQSACVAACCHCFWQSVVLHHPPQKDLTASPLSCLLLEPSWSILITTAITCSMLSACISTVSSGCKRQQMHSRDRRTDVRKQFEAVTAPWLSLTGTNKETFTCLEWSLLSVEMFQTFMPVKVVILHESRQK